MEYALGFITIGAIVALAAASPGPDFAIVTKNALVAGRRAGFMTSLGVMGGIAVHITYLMLGIGVVISGSLLLFSVIKYLGAAYLIYLGFLLIRSQGNATMFQRGTPVAMSDRRAIRDGFITNVLNPKATLFFLALFTQVIDPSTPRIVQAAYAVEILTIALLWFSALSYFLTTPVVSRFVTSRMKWVERTMGAILLALGLKVALGSNE